MERPPGNGESCPPRLPGSSRETFEVNHSCPLCGLGTRGSPTAQRREEEGVRLGWCPGECVSPAAGGEGCYAMDASGEQTQ